MANIGELLKDFEFNDLASEDQIVAFERTEGIRQQKGVMA
jgi:hypothetical protein